MKTYKKLNLGFIALAALSFFAADVSAKHLFILSGQSNMARFNPEKVFQPMIEASFGAAASPGVARGGDGSDPRRREE